MLLFAALRVRGDAGTVSEAVDYVLGAGAHSVAAAVFRAAADAARDDARGGEDDENHVFTPRGAAFTPRIEKLTLVARPQVANLHFLHARDVGNGA